MNNICLPKHVQKELGAKNSIIKVDPIVDFRNWEIDDPRWDSLEDVSEDMSSEPLAFRKLIAVAL
jgi:hypothetical protein